MAYRVNQNCGVCGERYSRMSDEPDTHKCADPKDRAEVLARKKEAKK